MTRRLTTAYTAAQATTHTTANNSIFHLPSSSPVWLRKAAEQWLGLNDCAVIYERSIQAENSATAATNFLSRILATMKVQVQTDRHELVRIPRSGACVVTANHPFGGIEGIALVEQLLHLRPDVKVLANSMLARIPELHEFMIFVNPFGGKKATQENHKGLREAYRWVEQGGMLAVFPAGEVSSLNVARLRVEDTAWKESIARLIRSTNASVVPAWIRGRNSWLFHLSGLLHPRLRTLQLAREFANKQHTSLLIRFASVLQPSVLQHYSDDAMMKELRRRSYFLRYKSAERRVEQSLHFVHKPIADAEAPHTLEQEIQHLPPEQLLHRHGEFSVYHATSTQIPYTLREIARLRETTFRYAGEGTGNASDSDEFDAWYTHLFLWNTATQQVVGAYRIGRCDDIIRRTGVRGLYTSSLFKLKQDFPACLSPALELGRSFVRVEYQKNYAPLMLLWRGIGEFLVRFPQYKLLFGAVSISDDYALASRRLLLNSLLCYHYNHRIAAKVRARTPLPSLYFSNWDALITHDTLKPVDELAPFIAELEADAKGVPVLLRHYLKLGGQAIAFNLDKKFSNVIDALVVVDLSKTDKDILARYMGGEGASLYVEHHKTKERAKELSAV